MAETREKKRPRRSKATDADSAPQFTAPPAEALSTAKTISKEPTAEAGGTNKDILDIVPDAKGSIILPSLSAKERKKLERRAEKELRKTKKHASKDILASADVLPEVREDFLEKNASSRDDVQNPEELAGDSASGVRNSTVDAAKPSKRSKKRKREKGGDTTSDAMNGIVTDDFQAELEQQGVTSRPASRFIAFIGNLPFTATTAAIEQHFSSITPFTVRPLSDKKTGKFKGCAFIEFETYDKMESCLRLFHHSKFSDARGKERKINVELTAGGGGKSGNRMEKIKEKNKKLQEERKRKVEEENEGRKKRQATTTSGPNTEVLGEQSSELENTGIHPSRRARVNV